MDDKMSEAISNICTILGGALLLYPIIDQATKTIIPEMKKLAPGEITEELKALPPGEEKQPEPKQEQKPEQKQEQKEYQEQPPQRERQEYTDDKRHEC